MNVNSNPLWEGVSNFVLNVAFGISGNAAYDFIAKPILQSVIQTVLPVSKHKSDLQSAVTLAFHESTKRLKKETTKEDTHKILQQLQEDSSKLFPAGTDRFPSTVLNALVLGSESALQNALWNAVERPY